MRKYNPFKIAIAYIVFVGGGAIFPSQLTNAQSTNNQPHSALVNQSVDTVSVPQSFLFDYQNGSGILRVNYKQNAKSFRLMDTLMKSEKANLTTGKSHLTIISYILPTDLECPEKINKGSEQANVLRSYFKIKHKLVGTYSTFAFDTAHHTVHSFRITYLPTPLPYMPQAPVPAAVNRMIHYTLKTDAASVLSKVNRYHPIPVLGDKISCLSSSDDPKKEEPIVIAIQQDTTTLAIVEQPKNKELTLRDVGAVCNSTNVKDDLHKEFSPHIALKTNLLCWAGITLQNGYHYVTPNIELEYYFAQRWSVNVDFERTHREKNEYAKAYNITTFGIEPRCWIKVKNHFRGLYGGTYFSMGDFDKRLQDISVKGEGNTGKYCEVGATFGYYFPLNNRWGVEAGLRCGQRWVNGDVYIACTKDPTHQSETFDYKSSYTVTPFKITGVRFTISYRFGH